MSDPSPGMLSVGLSAFMMLAGPIGVLAGYRFYSPEQRSRAEFLYHVYLCVWVFVSIVGTASLVWMIAEGVEHSLFSFAQTFMLLPLGIVQWRMHKQMEYVGWFG